MQQECIVETGNMGSVVQFVSVDNVECSFMSFQTLDLLANFNKMVEI